MIVLDASALLALLRRETGSQHVADHLDSGAVSAVNWSEVLQKVAKAGGDVDRTADRLRALGIRVYEFTVADAAEAARLFPITQSGGLSLAERACLALARRFQVTAMTADKAWGAVDAGVTVELIR